MELIQRKQYVGKGGYGIVHLGSYRGHKEVGIKDIQAKLSEEALAEANILKNLTHRNIIQYIDIIQTRNQTTLIMEFIDGGCLRDYIQRTAQSSTYWRTTRQIMLGVADGMSYLHGQLIVHADLKSLNVLLRHNYEAVICDFGLARTIADSETVITDTVAGTERWFAPELCFDQPERSSFPSDVWAFGCVILEITSQKDPWKDDYEHSKILTNALGKQENAIIFENICLSQRAPEKLRAILCGCCAWQKTDRPKFPAIVRDLSDISETDLQKINQESEKPSASAAPYRRSSLVPKADYQDFDNVEIPFTSFDDMQQTIKRIASIHYLTDLPNINGEKGLRPSSVSQCSSKSSSSTRTLCQNPDDLETLSTSYEDINQSSEGSPSARHRTDYPLDQLINETTRRYDPIQKRHIYKGPNGAWFYVGSNGKKMYSKNNFT